MTVVCRKRIQNNIRRFPYAFRAVCRCENTVHTEIALLARPIKLLIHYAQFLLWPIIICHYCNSSLFISLFSLLLPPPSRISNNFTLCSLYTYFTTAPHPSNPPAVLMTPFRQRQLWKGTVYQWVRHQIVNTIK